MAEKEFSDTISYMPRKCSATNRLITAKDHASVQINVGHVDESGKYTGQFTTFALCGHIRATGESDAAVNRLCRQHKLMPEPRTIGVEKQEELHTYYHGLTTDSLRNILEKGRFLEEHTDPLWISNSNDTARQRDCQWVLWLNVPQNVINNAERRRENNAYVIKRGASAITIIKIEAKHPDYILSSAEFNKKKWRDAMDDGQKC